MTAKTTVLVVSISSGLGGALFLLSGIHNSNPFSLVPAVALMGIGMWSLYRYIHG